MLDKLFEVNAWFGYLIATLTILAAAELGRLVGIATRRGRAEAMSTHRGCRTPGAPSLTSPSGLVVERRSMPRLRFENVAISSKAKGP